MLELLQETLCYLENHSKCPVCVHHLTTNEAKRLRHLQIKLAAGILEQLNKTCQRNLQLVKYNPTINVASSKIHEFPETDFKLSKFDAKVVIPNIKEEVREEINEEKVTFPWNQNLTEILHEDSSNEYTLEESDNVPVNDELISVENENGITLVLCNDGTSNDEIIRVQVQQDDEEDNLEEDDADYQEDDDDDDYQGETENDVEIIGEDGAEENAAKDDDVEYGTVCEEGTTGNNKSSAADDEYNKITSEEAEDDVVNMDGVVNKDEGQEETEETPLLEEDPFAEIFKKLQKKKKIMEKRRKKLGKLKPKPLLDEEVDWQPTGDEERDVGFSFCKCHFCYRRFSTEHRRQRHEQRFHFGKNPFKCQKCGEGFEFQTLLREHFKTHAGEPDIEMMDRSQAADENAGRTEEVVHEDGGNAEWISPEEPNHDNRIFQCNLCYMRFCKESAREVHVQRVHLGEDPFKCEECGEAFPYKGFLEKHFKQKHRSEKVFKCYRCDKGFISPGFLNSHILAEVCAAVTCDVCGKQVSKRSFGAHKQRHETPKQTIECELCDKKFTLKASLQSHVNIVHNHQRFVCDVCGNSYVSKSSLTAHMYLHTGDIPFQCEICSKQFTTKCKFKQHINVTHATERPHSCDLCNKRFKTTDGLKRHAVLHTGNKNVQCDICGRKFYRHSNMLKHKKVHAKEQLNQPNPSTSYS